MKNFSTILFSTLLTCLFFSAILYTACSKSNKCKNIACQNGGTCSNGACICPSGYEGALCETKTDPCKAVTCKNGGTCIAGNCHCPVGFSGKQCEINACDTITCFNGGTCSHGACQCPTGYEGNYCETQIRAKYLGVWTGLSGGDTVTIVIDTVLQSNLTRVNVHYYINKNLQFDVSPDVTSTSLTMAHMQSISNGKEAGFGMTLTGNNSASYSYAIHDIINSTSVPGAGTVRR